MEKPKVFVNSINKRLNNNENEYYYRKEENVDVENMINNIFKSSNFVYKTRVELKLKNNKRIVADVIAIKNNELITLDGNKIKIDDILNIKKA